MSRYRPIQIDELAPLSLEVPVDAVPNGALGPSDGRSHPLPRPLGDSTFLRHLNRNPLLRFAFKEGLAGPIFSFFSLAKFDAAENIAEGREVDMHLAFVHRTSSPKGGQNYCY